MTERTSADGAVAMKAHAADRGLIALEDGSCLLLMIAQQIDATEEKEAQYSFHLWAAGIRFVGRALSDEGDEMRKFMRSEPAEPVKPASAS